MARNACQAPCTSPKPLLLGIALLVTGLGFTGAAADRQSVLARLTPAPPADPDKPPPSRPCPDPPCFKPSAGRTHTAFLNWVGTDVSTFWRKRVQDLPLPYRWLPGRQLIVASGRKYESSCFSKRVTSTTIAAYCRKDKPATVYLPLDRLRSLVLKAKTWQRWRRRDFALAYVVAHEWAHHLQNVLRLLEDREVRGMKIELQADCLAGVWAHSMWARSLLEPGDIREAIALARLVGDAPGSPKNNPNAHGRASQREGWFKRGYETGEARNCVVS